MFWRKRKTSDFRDEIESHLQMEAARLCEQGLSEEDARAAARRAFGNMTQAQERFYESRRWLWWDHLRQDLRFSLRILRKNPAFTAIVVLTLALGIGANTAIFSVVYTVLLKALPYPQADRLVMVYENVHLPNYQNKRNTPAPGNFSDWSAQNTVFGGMAAYTNRSFNVTGTGEPMRLEGELVTAGFFSTLRVNAVLGRVFAPEEDRPS